MKQLTLSEIKYIQLNILKKFDAFCKERNLRYSLGGGTLLGAVRHKGYIPWDDDVDVMMPRSDYEQFLKEWNYDGYPIRNAHNDSTLPFMFSKILDTHTMVIEFDRPQTCLFIDVFPIDGISTKEHIPDFLKGLKQYERRLKYGCKQKGQKLKYPLLKYYYRTLYRWEESVNACESYISQYSFEKSSYAGAVCGRYGEKEVMPVDVFKSYIHLPFEDGIFMCIANYHDYLTQHYGDYMTLPSKENQIGTHIVSAYKI